MFRLTTKTHGRFGDFYLDLPRVLTQSCLHSPPRGSNQSTTSRRREEHHYSTTIIILEIHTHLTTPRKLHEEDERQREGDRLIPKAPGIQTADNSAFGLSLIFTRKDSSAQRGTECQTHHEDSSQV
ncbi:unnamed protein product [Ectocarpus sp. 12 AP-2014]